MKKTYQTYHAEHGSEHGESRVCDVSLIPHGQKDHPAVHLPLKPTDLKCYKYYVNKHFEGSCELLRFIVLTNITIER